MLLSLDGVVLSEKLQLKVIIYSKIDLTGKRALNVTKIQSGKKIHTSRGRSMVRRMWMTLSNSYHTTGTLAKKKNQKQKLREIIQFQGICLNLSVLK